MKYRLGRKHVPDARDWTVEKLRTFERGYLAARAAAPTIVVPKYVATAIQWLAIHCGVIVTPVPPTPPTPPAPSQLWADPVVLDQGDTGTCVGNGWAGWGDSDPVTDHYTEADARKIYLEATTIEDGKPDTSLQEGTTVRAGAKAMQNRKRLVAYANATTIEDVKDWILNKGPVVLGTDWTDDMFEPDAKGVVTPTGSVAGGHCYLAIGWDAATKLFRFRNSWGSSWGVAGDFFMTDASLSTLLARDGDAFCALELS